MPNDINVPQLIINKLTKEQYSQAHAEGAINDTELYLITDDDANVDYVSDDDVLAFIASMNYISPIASNSNAIYVDKNNKIYTL